MARKESGGYLDSEDVEEAVAKDGMLQVYGPQFHRLKQIASREAELETELKALSQEKEEITEVLVSVMDDNLVSRITVDGTTFFRRNDRYPKVEGDQQDALIAWLNTIDRGDMIKPTVNHQSLRSLIGEREKQGEDVPAFISVFEKKRVSMRNS